MKTIKHKKGKHNANIISKLRTFYKSIFSKSIEVKFTEDSKYDGNTSWNKILGRGGIRYNFKEKVRKTEQMLVWRYLKNEDIFEVAEYKRINYKWSADILCRMKTDERKQFSLDFLKSPIPTGAYFGGRETPNRNLTYQIK